MIILVEFAQADALAPVPEIACILLQSKWVVGKA